MDIPCKERFYDDFSVGEKFSLGTVVMKEEEMINFATQFDPQRFHLDPEAAAQTIYGGLIASGWHTGSLMMKLLTEGFLGEHSLGAAGLSELSWPAPVRVGDVLTLTVEIMKKRESKSRQHLGLIEIKNQLVNQNGEVALQAVPTMLIAMKDDSEGS
ncbi:MAG: acyl dehydratase [Acidimicrobiaceae bacterium]|nr:acyl dehydratase [Acidimicrobiaceae bacterium]